jgi:hypothetical protein
MAMRYWMDAVTAPRHTLLYQVIRVYWPEFKSELACQVKYLPTFICREFDEYLNCGRLEHGFLRVRCEACHHEKLVASGCKRRGFYPSYGARRDAAKPIRLQPPG